MIPLKDYISKQESKFELYDWSRQIIEFFDEEEMNAIDCLEKYPFKLGYDYIYMKH